MGTLDVTKIPATYKCSNQRHHQQVQHNEPHGGLRNDDLPLLQEGEVGPTVERNTTQETDSLLIVAGVSLFYAQKWCSCLYVNFKRLHRKDVHELKFVV